MSANLSQTQREVLRALCNTFVPSIQANDDPTGFWARSASDLGVDLALASILTDRVPDGLRAALLGLLDGLAATDFVQSPQSRREGILRELADSSPAVAPGLAFYQKQTVLLAYGLPDTPGPDPNLVTYGAPKGQNPNWEVLGYPGPISVPREKPKDIQTLVPDGDLTLEADVCIVGSGAGGGVIASKLSARGLQVVVLEAGGHYNSSDFHQLELWSYQHLWYRGGATLTANGTVNLLAGATLGGGTEINWMNCIRTPALVRKNWVEEFGLEGIDSAEYDDYMDVVERRLSVGSETAYFNAHNLRMREGSQRLGYLTKQTRINWDPARFNPLMAGYTGLGDQSGAKQTARRTFLLDAFRNGARFIVHCRADRILVENGRAAGVEATYSDPQGRTARVTVRARQVVAAGGSLESPALLLRSGIGGPAVGRYLRVQPGGAVYGAYKEKQRGWWGSPMTANCEQFTDTGGGFGFYMEIPAFAPGFYASVIPWSSALQHKELMTKVPYLATFIWFLREKGHGQVTIDPAGNAVPTYQLSDETDQKNFRHATATAIRIHEAAGAEEIYFGLSKELVTWRRGRQDLESFIRHVATLPLLDGAQPIISAHQLCTCRMGRDPADSVADTNGELRDVKGVWIGDGSACPTSLGANPMITIMSLASRTADKMAAAAGRANDRSSAPDLGNQRSCESGSPTLAHLMELTAAPGQGSTLASRIRDEAIPRIIRPADGLMEQIVLQSASDPDRLTAITFWRDKAALDGFDAYGVDEVSALLKNYLSAKPERRQFEVGASTDRKIRGWQGSSSGAVGALSANAETLVRGMVALMNPLNVLRLGERLFARSARWAEETSATLLGADAEPGGNGERGPSSPMFSHILELTSRPGQSRRVVELIRDEAIPSVILPARGFIAEIVLQSLSDPDHVTAISFWTDKGAADEFNQHGFAPVSALLQGVMAVPPQRRSFYVVVSANAEMRGQTPGA